MARMPQQHAQTVAPTFDGGGDGQLARFALSLLSCERLDAIPQVCDPAFCERFGIRGLRLLWRIGGGTGSDIHRGAAPAVPFSPYLRDLIDHCPGEPGLTTPLDPNRIDTGIAL